MVKVRKWKLVFKLVPQARDTSVKPMVDFLY
jgi:hypothetical protein